MSTNDELERSTFSQLGEDFIRSAVGEIHSAYGVSYEDCRQTFAATEFGNVLPWYKRGKVEGGLRSAASRYAHLTSVVVQAPASNWNHTEVRGGMVVLTANSVDRPGALPEKAEYRIDLAQTNLLSLFDQPEGDLGEDVPLYVMLAHSRSRWDSREEYEKWGHLPGSVYLIFPAATLDHSLHKVDLFARYPDVVANHRPDDLSGPALIRYINGSRASFYGRA